MSFSASQKRIIAKNNIISYSSEAYQFCKNINNINNQNEKGEAPIYSSILTNNIISLKKLLLSGTNPNIQNVSGETPLYLSVTNNNYDAFLLLLKNNADCNIQNKSGDTPLHAAIQMKKNKYIKYLLKSDANPNIQNLLYGKTPTHLAMENKLEEDILKLFKEYNADIFSIKDKYNKTPFDYAKDSNDEAYINLVMKIFGYNILTVINNKNNMNMTQNINNIFMNNTEENKCNMNIQEKVTGNSNINSYNNNNVNTDYYMITTETNKYEFKIDNNDSSKEGQHQSQIRNKIILSSDISSDNVQIKELNNSFDINSNKSKTVKEIFNNELSRNNNNKENIEPNGNKNININNLYSQASESSNYSKNQFNKRASRNSDKSKNKKSSIAISHSNSSNNYNSLINNQYLTNSVGINRKIIKNIIHDTVKKISVKSISSSEDNNTSKSNVNILSKESEINSYSNSNKDDSKSKISKISLINNNVDNIKMKENESIKIQNNNVILGNNIDDNSVINLYENGTNSFLLLKSKNLNDIINNDNISVSKLIKNETKTINLNRIYDELYSSTNKANEFNSIKIKDDNENNNNINIKEIVPIDNNNIIINTNGNSKLNINEIKGDIILESMNSNLFDELDIKTDNIGTINNDISLSYSRNLQTEEDNQNQLKIIQNKTIDMENNNKITPENKSNSNSNLEIRIIDPDNANYQKKSTNVEISTSNSKIKLNDKINISDNKNKDNISIINNNASDKEIRTDSHMKKKSNGILQSNDDPIKNKSIIDNHMKKDKSEIKRHSISSTDNLISINGNNSGVNNSPLLKRKIIKKNINKNKDQNQIYLKHHRQLSYHLNSKSNLNNMNKDKDTSKKMDDNSNLNGTDYSNLNLDASNINKENHENIKNKENNNPNNNLLKNENIYRNKNNLINAWHNNNNSNKSTLKSKNLNNISEINRVSRISLSKSGSSQNLNPPPIIFKEISLSSSNQNSIVNQNSNNHVIHNKNKNNKFSNPNTILNNTTLSTKKPMHSSYGKANNNIPNNLKNIPVGNNTSNNNSKYVNIKQYNSNIFNDDDDSDDSNNNSVNNEIKQLKDIPTPILIKLREWLLSCDLLCYYNLLLSKNMYHIDSYISDIKNGNIPITYEKIEKIGIKKPGHIFRLLVKLDLNAGLIDKNLFNYIIDKINFNSVTNTLVLNSSSNDAFCCCINLCPEKNNNHIVNNQHKRNLRNKGIYFNDLSSFLRVNDIIRFKGNFLHNGFDKIEFIIIQLFSRYAFNRKILNEYLHIYIDRDKIKILNILYSIKVNIAKEFGIKINEDEYNKIINSFHKEDKENDINKIINKNIENNDIISNQNCSNINNSNNIENNSNQNCTIF